MLIRCVRSVTLATASFWLSFAACSGAQVHDSQDAGGASGASTCSTGAPYAWDTRFPYVSAPPGYTVDTNNPPACAPHCGHERNYPSYAAFPYEALPSGSCSTADALCSMHAWPTCPCTGVNTAGYDTFYCQCSAGEWQCSIIMGSVSTNMGCPSASRCSADASADAAN